MKFERNYLIRRSLIIFYCVVIGFLVWRFILPRTGFFLYGTPFILMGLLMWGIWEMDEREIRRNRIQETSIAPQSEPAHAPIETDQDSMPAAEQAPVEQEE